MRATVDRTRVTTPMLGNMSGTPFYPETSPLTKQYSRLLQSIDTSSRHGSGRGTPPRSRDGPRKLTVDAGLPFLASSSLREPKGSVRRGGERSAAADNAGAAEVSASQLPPKLGCNRSGGGWHIMTSIQDVGPIKAAWGTISQDAKGGCISEALHMVDAAGFPAEPGVVQQMTPLLAAWQEGRVDVVRLLVNADGCDANKAKDDGATPLYIACFKGLVYIVRRKLEGAIRTRPWTMGLPRSSSHAKNGILTLCGWWW